MSDEVREVLDTFRVAARIGTQSLGAYIISMAQSASDVLCVELLQREARLTVSCGGCLRCRPPVVGRAGRMHAVFCGPPLPSPLPLLACLLPPGGWQRLSPGA